MRVRRKRNPPDGARRAFVGTLGFAVGAGLLWYLFADRVRYGAKVGEDAPSGKWLPVSPRKLADRAGVHVDTYTTAAIMRSEAGSGPEAERIAVAWVAKNAAKRGGRSVTAYATRARVPVIKMVNGKPVKTGKWKDGKSAGFYGPQNIEARKVSTRLAPRTRDIELATEIANGEHPDPTGGATNFIHPKAQSALVGKKGYRLGTQKIIDRWRVKYGLHPRKVPGAPRLLVFVPKSKASV